MEFTRKSFLFTTVFAHIMAIGLIVRGTWIDWVFAFCLFIVLTLISTTFYHRLLSHSAWSPALWVQKVGVLLGVFSLTGTPLTRTAVHRAHHKYVDTPDDPHSPKFLPLYLIYLPQLKETKLNMALVRDVLRTPWLMKIHEHYNLLLLSMLLILPFKLVMIWGAAATLVWIDIFLCNWLCHQRGIIRNDNILAAITFGEGHHDHHHNNPTDPRFGSFDLGYWLIRNLT